MTISPRQRRRLADAAIVLVTAAWPLALATEVARDGYSWPTGGRLVLEVGAGVVAVALLLGWRRTHPTAVALALLPIAPSAFAVIPWFVALYGVAARRDRKVAVAVAVAYVAVSLATGVMMSPGADGGELLYVVAFHAVAVALGMVRNARLALYRELEDRAVRAETEQRLRVEQARRLERQRIAREMHDVVAHRLSMVSLHAGALAYRPDAAPEEVARAGDVIRASAHEALEELRAVIGVLRESDEDTQPERPQPTLADLPALLERCREAGARLQVDDRVPAPDTVPPAVGRTAYRVLEEALTNAAKHAPDAPVAVSLHLAEPCRLVVEVSNPVPVPSRRPDASAIPGSGAGLIGLAERVEVGGGRLDQGRTDDGRFRVRAEVPWSP